MDNNPELGENGESIILDRQENFSIEQDEDQLITHKQTIVVEKFRYSKDNENGGNKDTNLHERTSVPPNVSCTSSLSANIHKLENAEIQLSKLANEVSSEIQRVRDLRNCLLNAKNENEKNSKYFVVDNDKTWDQNLIPKPYNDQPTNEPRNMLYAKRGQLYDKSSNDTNSPVYAQAVYSDSRNTQSRSSRNEPVRENVFTPNGNSDRKSDARYSQRRHSSYDKNDLHEYRKSDQGHDYSEELTKSQNFNRNGRSSGKNGKQRNSQKRYSRYSRDTDSYETNKYNNAKSHPSKTEDSDSRPLTASIEANNTKTKQKQIDGRNSTKNEEPRNNQRLSASEYRKRESSSDFNRSSICDCKCVPHMCRILTPCMEYNCYCNKYEYEYPLQAVQPYNNFCNGYCTNCGCCCAGGLCEELLIDAEAINIQSIAEGDYDLIENKIDHHKELSKYASVDSNNSGKNSSSEELLESPMNQLSYSKHIQKEDLQEVNNKSDFNKNPNELKNYCCYHFCCCNSSGRNEPKTTSHEQKLQNMEKNSSNVVQPITTKSPSKSVETKSISKEKRNRKKSESTAPSRKSLRNSVNRRNSSQKDRKEKKTAKNNTPSKHEEPSSSTKKKVTKSRDNSFAGNEKNENNENKNVSKKIEAQKHKLKKGEKFIDDKKKLTSKIAGESKSRKDQSQKIELVQNCCEHCCCCCQRVRNSANENLKSISKNKKEIAQSQSEDYTDSENNNDIVINYENIPEAPTRTRRNGKERRKEEDISETIYENIAEAPMRSRRNGKERRKEEDISETIYENIPEASTRTRRNGKERRRDEDVSETNYENIAETSARSRRKTKEKRRENDISETNYENIDETSTRSKRKSKEKKKEEYISEAKSDSNYSNQTQNKKNRQSSEQECQSQCSTSSLVESLENEEVNYIATHLRSICCHCNFNNDKQMYNTNFAKNKLIEPNASQQKNEASNRITNKSNESTVSNTPINQNSTDRNIERTSNNLTAYTAPKIDGFLKTQQTASMPYQNISSSNSDKVATYTNNQLVPVCCPCCHCRSNNSQNIRSSNIQNQNRHRSKGGNEPRKRNNVYEANRISVKPLRGNGNSYNARNYNKHILDKGYAKTNDDDDASRRKQFSIKKYKLKNEKTLLRSPKTPVESKHNTNYIRDSSFDSDFLLESLNTFKKMRCKPYRS
ncbi:putative uncharacterized protein DDB_G0282133 [Teleopsis dalmanni]|uniref:putative uncharacterized protein DDB_G0282133 n=1 Tax=Teleopsis dalmanni TaxID=139649 RepID=UPI0018CCF7EB|nr:putative uncharacterized protein DDB_G0282133 [Teleopsis dalmanni]